MAKQNDTPVFDLSSVLTKPVADSNAQPVFELDREENIQDAQFDEEQATDPNVEQLNEPAAAPGPDPKRLSPDDIAIIAVNLIDGLQKAGFSLAKRKMMFSDEELTLLGGLDHDKKTIYPGGSREAIAMGKWKKYTETIKKLPFEPDEKKRLTDASIIYARTMDLKVSPFAGLCLAFTEVLGTRAYTVFAE